MCPLYKRNAAELSRGYPSARTRPVKAARIVAPLLTFLVLDLGEFGVDDVSLIGLARCFGFLAGLSALRLLRIGVHFLAEFLRRLRERLRLGVDLRLVVGLHRAFGVLERGFDLRLFVSPELVAVLLERLAHRV